MDVQTKIDGDKTTVTVKVQSLVPHNLPATHPAWATVISNLEVKGKNLKTVLTDGRVFGRTYADAKGQKTVFDFEAVKVLDDTVLKRKKRELRPSPFPCGMIPRCSQIWTHAQPVPLLERVEAESSKGSQDPVFHPIEIVPWTETYRLISNVARVV